MKILTVSDKVEPAFQNELLPQELAGTELILACGDLPPEYLTRLTTTLHAPLYYIKGNHDIRYATKPPGGCLDIHARIVTFNNIKILGLDGSRWYNGGPNQFTENQMKWTLWKLLPLLWCNKGVDIVISHAPPRHVHDAEDRCHRGFKSFHPLIRRFSPSYFIHGHIHALFNDPSERMTTINQTQVINSYGHYLFEIDTGGSPAKKQKRR
ncbi:MAG: metallophosphoesterase [Thermodesulfobacteriota bacterium]